MIDLHCHILPDLDDGAQGIEESIAMSRIAVNDGIKTIVATPHTMNGTFVNERESILSGVRRLQEELFKEGIGLRIIPGADVHVNHNIIDLIKEGKALTVNDMNRYILLELPHHLVPPKIPDLIFELRINGITPIFTHPERNSVIQDDLGILLRFIEQGALTQITSMSLTGEFGQKARSRALDMLTGNMVHFIASDAHSSRFRTPQISKAVEIASQVTGPEWANAMVTINPQAILDGSEIPEIPDPVMPKKSFYRRLFG